MSKNVFNSIFLTSSNKRKFHAIVSKEISGMSNSKSIETATDVKFRIMYYYRDFGELFAEFNGTGFIDQLIEISAHYPGITFKADITLDEADNSICGIQRTTYKAEYKNGVEKITSKKLKFSLPWL